MASATITTFNSALPGRIRLKSESSFQTAPKIGSATRPEEYAYRRRRAGARGGEDLVQRETRAAEQSFRIRRAVRQLHCRVDSLGEELACPSKAYSSQVPLRRGDIIAKSCPRKNTDSLIVHEILHTPIQDSTDETATIHVLESRDGSLIKVGFASAAEANAIDRRSGCTRLARAEWRELDAMIINSSLSRLCRAVMHAHLSDFVPRKVCLACAREHPTGEVFQTTPQIALQDMAVRILQLWQIWLMTPGLVDDDQQISQAWRRKLQNLEISSAPLGFRNIGASLDRWQRWLLDEESKSDDTAEEAASLPTEGTQYSVEVEDCQRDGETTKRSIRRRSKVLLMSIRDSVTKTLT